MDAELVARLRGVIPRLARQLNETSTGEDLTPTQYSVLALVRIRGPLGLAELTDLPGLSSLRDSGAHEGNDKFLQRGPAHWPSESLVRGRACGRAKAPQAPLPAAAGR